MKYILDSVKRETGASPVRTRHCNKMITVKRKQPLTDVGKAIGILIFKSGDLPGIGTK